MINGGACQLSLLRNGIQILEEYQQFVFFTFLFLLFTKVVNCKLHKFKQKSENYHTKTSQELRMLSSVTLDCQVTKIVMNSGSQLSEL